MIHPVMNGSYCLNFIDENGFERTYNSWLIRRPDVFPLDVAHTVESFNRRFPGVLCYLMWFNPATQQNQEVTLGSPLNSKYALFSED